MTSSQCIAILITSVIITSLSLMLIHFQLSNVNEQLTFIQEQQQTISRILLGRGDGTD